MPTSAARILISDDQTGVRESLRLLLKSEGYKVETAASPEAVLAALEGPRPDLLLLDMNYTRDTTSGQEGLDLLARVQAREPELPVVVMTAWGSIDLAVEAMRRGAKDFIQKPWENARLLATLRTHLELAGALRRTRQLEAENQLLREGAPTLVAASPAMRRVLDLVARIGPSDASVLITGENGTGKSLLAQALHAASSRADRPLLTLNAGGLAEGVLESELFGHAKGAFTDAKAARAGRFELADGGTLFLDEIANAPLTLQARLLRVLETGEFERVGSSRTLRADVRVLSATNADLEAEVEAGRFRQDLRYRLNTIEIHVPPLRERPEDILPLAARFLEARAGRYRKAVAGFDAGAEKALLAHSWPGNVRELTHAVERALLMASGPWITAADLMLAPGNGRSPALEDLSMEDMEALLIRKALARHGGAAAAAEALGLSRSAMYRRLAKLGIRA
ncbi:sigma-54-dependent transcriptional regulator [Mesoterricola sediminis]|uniref:Sigma-54-dependent Fis family transcriptional regulator n=1 Tax=Mesoterricola sediminis TaxID=2927980 RepID=A0AA48H2U5_9BACT|nr:sigma-54 dependent transcriptional regulator [Mesoterricola sediminis]BDU78587.1 sigma-54-dependent Fis family transcriptional regulator [Mesoterricola sediminis]